jgi:arylsulfatase A-like enzyme
MQPGRVQSTWVAVTAALLGSLTATCAAEPTPTGQSRPNVVLIVSDDQHWGDYGFMGHPQLRTPQIDRLAAESLVFRRGYVPSSLCCPSLASLITGRFPHEHGIVGNDPPEIPGSAPQSPAARQAFRAGREVLNDRMAEWPTLPRLLAEHGYRSLQTGKWWQGHFSRGGFTEGMTKGGRHGDEGLEIGRATMQPIKDFIARCRQDDTPFFIWYAPMLPHDPHDPPQDLVDHYATKTDSIHVARYWGNVERFDRTVGDLLEHLDQTGLAANTLVVYVTDNGWLQNTDNPRFAVRSKQSPHDGGLRTPIMLRRPGVIRPASSDALASSLDILPTVLAATGIPAPAGLPGLNLLDQQAVAARRQLFGECYSHTIVDLEAPARGLLWRWTVRDNWKLILPAAAPPGLLTSRGQIVDQRSQAKHEQGAAELYDIAADPEETHDLANEHPDLVRELSRSLDAWWTPDGPAAAPRSASSRSTAARPPNLLVFLADDLGAHDLSCTGSSFYRTPAIDRLAADGLVFTRGYAACPVCSPTRAALVTGRHPARVGITNFLGGNRHGRLLPAPFQKSLSESEQTIAELLHHAGYATSVFGKWHLGDAGAIPAHGFATSGLTTVGPGSGPQDDPLHAQAIAAAASEFVRSQADQPWFCFVSMHSVHVPLVTRPELAAEEGRRAVGVAPRFNLQPQPPADPVTRAVQDHPVYAGMVREMDETVATVLAAVDGIGHRHQTLVVFTSDNGGLATAEGAPTSNLPLRAGKGFVYEGGIRVPLIVSWPGVTKPGATVDTPVTTLDIAATLLGAAKLTPPRGVILDGLDLAPLFAATDSFPTRDLYWHYPHYSNQGGRPAGALVTGAEKLIEHFEDGRVELFDLVLDPGERHDLAAEQPARTAELRERLTAWREQVGGLMPSPNPEPTNAFDP